jgi:hypothetical protein
VLEHLYPSSIQSISNSKLPTHYVEKYYQLRHLGFFLFVTLVVTHWLQKPFYWGWICCSHSFEGFGPWILGKDVFLLEWTRSWSFVSISSHSLCRRSRRIYFRVSSSSVFIIGIRARKKWCCYFWLVNGPTFYKAECEECLLWCARNRIHPV